MGNQQPPRTPDDDDRRTGYQTAVQLWAAQSEQMWSGFNAMVVANTIILGAVSLLATSSGALSYLASFLCFAGVLICVPWFGVMHRHFWYQDYYIDRASQLEVQISPDNVDAARAVRTVREGQDINAIAGKQLGDHPSTWGCVIFCLAKHKVRWWCSWIIGGFGVTYSVALGLSIWGSGSV